MKLSLCQKVCQVPPHLSSHNPHTHALRWVLHFPDEAWKVRQPTHGPTSQKGQSMLLKTDSKSQPLDSKVFFFCEGFEKCQCGRHLFFFFFPRSSFDLIFCGFCRRGHWTVILITWSQFTFSIPEITCCFHHLCDLFWKERTYLANKHNFSLTISFNSAQNTNTL